MRMKLVIGIAALASLVSLAAAKNQNGVKTMSKKQQVVELLNALESGAAEPVAVINPNKYIQHNLAIPDGLSGFGEFFSKLPKNSVKVKVIRSFQDGDYAFAHTQYEFFGPKVGFDVFRFENGKIVEHWDALAAITPANPSGHTQLDGSLEITDQNKTEANRKIVGAFVSDILINGKLDKLTQYIGETYIQHNSGIGDGLAGLGTALEALAKAGIKMVYTKNHKVLAEGNFVLSLSEGEFGGKHVAYYDLFRLENGKLVEHWDVIEEIPPQGQVGEPKRKVLDKHKKTCPYTYRGLPEMEALFLHTDLRISRSIIFVPARLHSIFPHHVHDIYFTSEPWQSIPV